MQDRTCRQQGADILPLTYWYLFDLTLRGFEGQDRPVFTFIQIGFKQEIAHGNICQEY